MTENLKNKYTNEFEEKGLKSNECKPGNEHKKFCGIPEENVKIIDNFNDETKKHCKNVLSCLVNLTDKKNARKLINEFFKQFQGLFKGIFS